MPEVTILGSATSRALLASSLARTNPALTSPVDLWDLKDLSADEKDHLAGLQYSIAQGDLSVSALTSMLQALRVTSAVTASSNAATVAYDDDIGIADGSIIQLPEISVTTVKC